MSLLSNETVGSSDSDRPIETMCMACSDANCDFKPMKFQRRPCGDSDVVIEMKYCGVCHSDLHSAAGHLNGITGPKTYPLVPGHELAGICIKVGRSVSKGTMINEETISSLTS